MVLAQGMAERLKQRKEKFRAELIEQGKAEGIVEGIVEGETRGRAALAAEVADWNRRRLEAEERGEKFDEPPPIE